jgi:hypothetical protein
MRPDQFYFMPIEEFKLAVRSLRDFPGAVGMMGGLPTKHPKFEEMCEVLRDNFPPSKLELWTSGEKEYFDKLEVVQRTFGHIARNDHTESQLEVCEHQVTTLALIDVVPDPELRLELVNECWVLDKWCPTIGHRPYGAGAFVCELMLGIDTLMDNSSLGGVGIDFAKDPRWWDRPVDDPSYVKQLREYCGFCSMCLPMQRQVLRNGIEIVSPMVYDLLKHNLSKCCGDRSKMRQVTGLSFTREDIEEAKLKGWDPHKFRGDLPSGEA